MIRSVIMAAAATAVAAGLGCAARAHRIDFTLLADANRVEVRNSSSDLLKTITDPSQIRVAAEFIRQFESGWRDPASGVRVPVVMLRFYKDTRFVGAYGIGDDYVVSDPPTAGFWSRKVPAGDIDRLRRDLSIGNGGPGR